MEIHEKIQYFVKKNKETSYSLAREYNASQQTVSNYLNGTNAMPIKFLSWYIKKHPEIDLYELFSIQQENIVNDPQATYMKKPKKQILIDRITAIINEEL